MLCIVATTRTTTTTHQIKKQKKLSPLIIHSEVLSSGFFRVNPNGAGSQNMTLTKTTVCHVPTYSLHAVHSHLSSTPEKLPKIFNNTSILNPKHHILVKKKCSIIVINICNRSEKHDLRSIVLNINLKKIKSSSQIDLNRTFHNTHCFKAALQKIMI